MRLRQWLVASIAVCAALLLIGRTVTTLVADHAWYDSMGAVAMFWEQFSDSFMLRGGAWLAGSLLAFVNLHAVRRTILAVALPVRIANLEVTAMLPARRLLAITVLLSALIGLALSVPFTDWKTVAMARQQIPFGEIDGILDHDLGFYVFQLPLEETAYLWALTALVAIIAVVVLLYALTRSLRMEGRRIVTSNHVRRHFSALGALVLLLLAWSYRLDAFDLLQYGSGADGLFLSIDHEVALRADRVLVVVCALASLIFLRAGWLGQVRMAFLTLTLVLITAVGVRHVLPIALTGTALIGDPVRRDQPYAATRTFFSRRAYDVDAMQMVTPETPQSVRTRLTPTEIASRVSLWDGADVRRHDPGDAVPEIGVGAVGWRFADGRAQAVKVRRSATGGSDWRVIASDVTNALMTNQRMEVALGVETDGAISVSADRAAEDSQGNRVGRGEPLVAPGLGGYRLVANQLGTIGSPLRSVGMRIAHAWDARDPSLLRRDTMPGASPRLVSHRDVRDRVARLAPMFAQADAVIPIAFDGSIVWAVNLYSASDRYPLSQRWVIAGQERSYFRFTATALVDATSGRVRFVPGDRLDPIAKVWLPFVSSMVVSATDLPAQLSAQLPPPIQGLAAQLQTFIRYGSRRSGNAARQIADSMLVVNDPTLHHVQAIEGPVPALAVPVLDGQGRLEGIVTVVGGRLRATRWDVMSGDTVRWTVHRDRLRLALDSLAILADRGRREPRLRSGPLHVVSGERGPVLVQSLIGNGPDGVPFVSRVAVLDGAHLYFGSTIADAFTLQTGGPSAYRSFDDLVLPAGVARDRRVTQLYDAMREALRRGQWTRFGAALDTLGVVLGRPPQ